MKRQVWTISELTKYLKHSLDNDLHIQSILLKGEISNFTNHRSGHLYFSLKDASSKMNCVMFSSYASRLKIMPKEGMKVIVSAKVSMYEPQGNIQLYVQAMQSDGIGDLYLQFEALKEKLNKLGYFNETHKKSIPTYPKSIGIISAKSAAALQDVLSIISRRWPLVDVQIYPTLVQGEQAANNMIQVLNKADQNNHDVLLLVRGGGSLEDLWCFNDERLALCIYNLNTCIVSGVGHETDTTLVDYVSDKRAPTPSAAAELITPNINEVKDVVLNNKNQLHKRMNQIIQENKMSLNYIKTKPLFNDKEYLFGNSKLSLMMCIKQLHQSENKLALERKYYISTKDKMMMLAIHYAQNMKKELHIKEDALITNMNDYATSNKDKLANNICLLDAFSPLKILQRGYSIVTKDNHIVKEIKDVNENDTIEIKLSDGTVNATVIERKAYE